MAQSAARSKTPVRGSTRVPDPVIIDQDDPIDRTETSAAKRPMQSAGSQTIAALYDNQIDAIVSRVTLVRENRGPCLIVQGADEHHGDCSPVDLMCGKEIWPDTVSAIRAAVWELVKNVSENYTRPLLNDLAAGSASAANESDGWPGNAAEPADAELGRAWFVKKTAAGTSLHHTQPPHGCDRRSAQATWVSPDPRVRTHHHGQCVTPLELVPVLAMLSPCLGGWQNWGTEVLLFAVRDIHPLQELLWECFELDLRAVFASLVPSPCSGGVNIVLGYLGVFLLFANDYLRWRRAPLFVASQPRLCAAEEACAPTGWEWTDDCSTAKSKRPRTA